MAKVSINKKINLKLKNIIMIPGGPGLGPISFFPLEEYLSEFNVYYYWPTPDIEQVNPSYKDLVDDLFTEASKINDLYLCGHSFGGVIATDIIVNRNFKAKGLICLATPFNKESFEYANKVFDANKTSKNIELDKTFDLNPSNQNYKEWFASYAHLYFAEENV